VLKQEGPVSLQVVQVGMAMFACDSVKELWCELKSTSGDHAAAVANLHWCVDHFVEMIMITKNAGWFAGPYAIHAANGDGGTRVLVWCFCVAWRFSPRLKWNKRTHVGV
jgi:hypothetical protein